MTIRLFHKGATTAYAALNVSLKDVRRFLNKVLSYRRIGCSGLA